MFCCVTRVWWFPGSGRSLLVLRMFPEICPIRAEPYYLHSFIVVLTLCDPLGCRPPGSSVHGIFQARILKWVAIHFFRGFFWPRDQTQISHTEGRFYIIWATREVQTPSNLGFILPFNWIFTFSLQLPWKHFILHCPAQLVCRHSFQSYSWCRISCLLLPSNLGETEFNILSHLHNQIL